MECMMGQRDVQPATGWNLRALDITRSQQRPLIVQPPSLDLSGLGLVSLVLCSYTPLPFQVLVQPAVFDLAQVSFISEEAPARESYRISHSAVRCRGIGPDPSNCGCIC
jgi:hypothetical protein